MDNQRPNHYRPRPNSVLDDFNHCHTLTIGMSDQERRKHLLYNASLGIGKTIQKGKDLHYIIGSSQYGYVEYIILNTVLLLK